MAIRIGVLPIDIIDSLSAQIDTNANHQFLRLPHPRTGLPCLFLPYKSMNASAIVSQMSIAEVQTVAPHNPRSWFLDSKEVVADGQLLIMTNVDPAFLLVPILRAIQPADGSQPNFRPADDIFEDAAAMLATVGSSTNDPTLVLDSKDVLHFASLDCTKAALSRVCESKELTSELTVYRFSSDKLLEMLRRKVERVVSGGVMEKSKTIIRGLAKDGLMEDGKEELLGSGRLKAACDLVCHYVSPEFKRILYDSYDFAKLDKYLKEISDEAMATVVALEPTKTKKGGKEPENGAGKKRKTKASVGVDKLKKANTNGMAKMDSFFKKKS